MNAWRVIDTGRHFGFIDSAIFLSVTTSFCFFTKFVDKLVTKIKQSNNKTRYRHYRETALSILKISLWIFFLPENSMSSLFCCGLQSTFVTSFMLTFILSKRHETLNNKCCIHSAMVFIASLHTNSLFGLTYIIDQSPG